MVLEAVRKSRNMNITPVTQSIKNTRSTNGHMKIPQPKMNYFT